MDEVRYLIADEDFSPSIVLADYLLSLPPGVIETYINQYTGQGGIVLDPFCQNEALAAEALRLGRRAILTDFSPITTFVARTSFSNLTGQQLNYAFIRLSEGMKLPTSLRVHLNQMYMTTCARCHRTTIASYYIWNRDENRPVKKHYVCEACRPANGTYQVYADAVDDADLERAQQVEDKGFPHTYVIDRLAADGNGQEMLAKQLLQLYTPRNLYGLVTILTQIEMLFDNPQHQDVLKLSLLDCFDTCSKLNAVAKNARPWNRGKELRSPARFIERNVWEAFEEAFKRIVERIERRQMAGEGARFASSAEQLLSGSSQAQREQRPSLLVKQLPAKSLIDEIPESSVDLAITVPPRPDGSAFMALSYFWSGWLFGPEQAAVFEDVGKLKNKVDWEAYFKLMLLSLKAVSYVLKRDCLLVLDFTGLNYEQCATIVLAGVASGFLAKRIIYQPFSDGENSPVGPFDSVPGHYCIQMTKLPHYVAKQRNQPASILPAKVKAAADVQLLEKSLKSSVGQAIRDILTQRAEPLNFNWLVVAVYEHLGKDTAFAEAVRNVSIGKGTFESLHRLIDDEIKAVLDKDYKTLPLGESESAFWWFARRSFSATPVSEQIEQSVFNVLSASSGTTEQSLSRVVYSLFPEMLTPEPGWIEQILESYAIKKPGVGWVLRPEDHLQKRQQQHAQVMAALVDLGHKLGYKVGIGRDQEKHPLNGYVLKDLLTPAERSITASSLLGGTRGSLIDVIWYDHAMPMHIFEVEWSAKLSDAVFARKINNSDVRKYLVIPEERIGLIDFKFRKSPWFRWAFEAEGWDFIKFHHLLKFNEEEKELTLFSLRKIFGLQPVIEFDIAQLPLL